MRDAQAPTTTPVGLVLLAELAGLDRWDFMDQIGEPVTGPWISLVSEDAPDPGQARTRAGPRRQATDVVADQVAAVAARLDQLAGCRERQVLLSAFASAMILGPHEVAAAPYLSAAAGCLLPVARALAAAPAAQWWWDLPDPHHQRWLGTGARQLLRGAALATALRAQAAADEEEERRMARDLPWPPERGTRYSGTWWSPPFPSAVFTTTGPIGPLPAVEIGCATDADEDRFEVWSIEISPQARIWNITSPDDWARLTARYPRDVTASRRHDWFHTTGRAGTWMLPDWPRAARDWDGVHLSVAGYITATGFAIPAAGAATVLTGWEPDQTLWINDVFARTDRVGTWTGTPGPEAFPDLTLPWLK